MARVVQVTALELAQKVKAVGRYSVGGVQGGGLTVRVREKAVVNCRARGKWIRVREAAAKHGRSVPMRGVSVRRA